MLILALFAACIDEARFDTGKSEDTDVTDTDTGTGGDGVSPVVTTASADCSVNGDGQGTWFITAIVTDPQGTTTLGFGSAEEWQKDPAEGGEPLNTHTTICTDDGTCTTSWEDNSGMGGCELEGRLWFRVFATDEDEHVSEPYSFQTVAA